MSYQKRDHWCGPAALQNALKIHGITLGQGRLAELLGTEESGTDEQDMIQLLDKIGAQWAEFSGSNRNEARRWILRMAPIAPLILCVDNWDHWVCVAGVCAERLWLLDSADATWNQRELGRWAMRPKKLLRRWKAARRCAVEGGAFYAIAVLTVDAREARKRARVTAGD